MAAGPKRFPGKDVDVTWDGRLCIHVAECGRSEGELFVGGRDPWCNPDLAASGDAVAEVCRRCPSGSLSYVRKDGGAAESTPPRNQVTVVSRGPLFVRGALSIDGAPDDAPGLSFRAALCRCGASNNKPFCDNSHVDAGFSDQGAVGQTGDPDVDPTGPVAVGRAPNGPLLLSGNVEILASSGRVAWRGSKCALCQCGQSNNKPFCDGSHKAAGFTAD